MLAYNQPMSESSPHPNALADLVEFLEIYTQPNWTGPGLTKNEHWIGEPDDAIKVHMIYAYAVPELVQRLRLALDFLTEAEPQLSILEDCDPSNHLHAAYLALRELLRTAIQNVRARRTIRLPKTPQEYKVLSVAAVQASLGTSARDASSRSADTESTKTNEKDLQHDLEKELPRSFLVAYQSFTYAEANMPQPPETDREAYDWLMENFPDVEEYTLPEFHTWVRYVREGRKHHGTQKNTPRPGREGRSIVKASDL